MLSGKCLVVSKKMSLWSSLVRYLSGSAIALPRAHTTRGWVPASSESRCWDYLTIHIIIGDICYYYIFWSKCKLYLLSKDIMGYAMRSVQLELRHKYFNNPVIKVTSWCKYALCNSLIRSHCYAYDSVWHYMSRYVPEHCSCANNRYTYRNLVNT